MLSDGLDVDRGAGGTSPTGSTGPWSKNSEAFRVDLVARFSAALPSTRRPLEYVPLPEPRSRNTHQA